MRKNEEKKTEEVRENFLQKALQGMGGHKLNISMDEEEENKEKEKEGENKDEEENTEKEENSDKDKDRTINKNDISSFNETKKGMFLFNSNKKFSKQKTQQFPTLFNSNTKNKNSNRKPINLNFEEILEDNKKTPYLSKNRNSIRKSIFSSKNGNKISNFELNLDSINTIKKEDRAKRFLRKFTKKKIVKKDEFLLFTKARPYRYMTSESK